MDELFDAGLLRLVTAKRFGGYGLPWPVLPEAARIAARACASTAWMIALVGGHGVLAGRFPVAARQQLFCPRERQLFATATKSTNGTLVRVGPEFVLDGTWQLCSGVEYASWILVTGNHFRPGHEEPERLMVAVRPQKAAISGNWQPAGMGATGSRDIAFSRLKVPEEFVISQRMCLQRNAVTAETYVDRVDYLPYAVSAIVGPIMGCAEGAVATCLELLSARRTHPGLAGTDVVAATVGESLAELSAARSLYENVLMSLHTAGCEDRDLNASEQAALRLDRSFLARLCLKAVARIMGCTGAAIISHDHPVQRHWRNLQVMASHIDVGWHRAITDSGTSALKY
ncbi:acyl-CoA dehydrogenase family protein [Paraburkholderia sp. J67]|uniref:acyl-CoA dehydrogenase family protein n=1 Tax=Paraburkholderia sp. J67 TaxID=2805435 RepID=UPI002ABD9673|nr:acyl-CoA dehydrogenase family protein [Paraburkholderia sp. J67]